MSDEINISEDCAVAIALLHDAQRHIMNTTGITHQGVRILTKVRTMLTKIKEATK